MIEHFGTTFDLFYEDERYPTLVVRNDETFGVKGYDVNLNTGELKRVCICNAYSESECICGAWDET